DSEDEQRRKLRHLGLHSSFPYLIVSASAGYEKPDVRIFQDALSLAGVEPAEAVFVGDRLDVDIAGAKTAGMRAVWFNHWGGSLDGASPGPDAVIESFSELRGVLPSFLIWIVAVVPAGKVSSFGSNRLSCRTTVSGPPGDGDAPGEELPPGVAEAETAAPLLPLVAEKAPIKATMIMSTRKP